MMSPLGLLQEGETAEIVEQNAGSADEYHNKQHHLRGYTHVHSRAQKTCCGQCENCSCRNTAHSRTSDHLMNMGLRAGKQVEMITNTGAGPLVLKADESRIALGRGAAMKIYVRRIEG